MSWPARYSGSDSDLVPLCSPGSHLSPETPNKCIPCKEGITFMDTSNRDAACRPCTECGSITVQATACSVTADTDCKCPDGFFKNVEGKCSPIVTTSGPAIDRTPFQRSSIVESSCSENTTQMWLIGMSTIAVIMAVTIVVLVVKLRKKQKVINVLRTEQIPLDEHDGNAFHARKNRHKLRSRPHGPTHNQLRQAEDGLSTYSQQRQLSSSAIDASTEPLVDKCTTVSNDRQAHVPVNQEAHRFLSELQALLDREVTEHTRTRERIFLVVEHVENYLQSHSSALSTTLDHFGQQIAAKLDQHNSEVVKLAASINAFTEANGSLTGTSSVVSGDAAQQQQAAQAPNWPTDVTHNPALVNVSASFSESAPMEAEDHEVRNGTS